MKKKVAVVDIDGTLIKGNSAEKSFFWFLYDKGYMKKSNFLRFALRMVWLIFTVGLDLAKGKNKSYLKGVEVQRLQNWIREYAETVLPELISENLRERIKALKKQGYEIILLSGSLQPLVDQIKEIVQADIAIGVELEENAGRITGNIRGIYPFSGHKLDALFQRINPDEVDWIDSWAFADRYADLPILNLVGNPVAVNPEKKLEKYAQKKGWEIIKL